MSQATITDFMSGSDKPIFANGGQDGGPDGDERQKSKRKQRDDSTGAFSETGEEFTTCHDTIHAKDTTDVDPKLLNCMDILMNRLEAKLENSIDRAVSKAMSAAMKDTNNLITDLKKENQDLKADIKRLNERVDDLTKSTNHNAQYSRKNTIRILGVPELQNPDEASKENCSASVVDSLKEIIPIEENDIEVSHRLGPYSLATKDAKPRAIIVKFKFRPVKDWVMQNKRLLKGSRLVIYEDLSPMNRDLLYKLKQHEEIERAWSSYGKIHAIPTGKKRHTFEVTDGDNLDEIINMIPPDPNNRVPRPAGPLRGGRANVWGNRGGRGGAIRPTPGTSRGAPLIRPSRF